MTLTTDTIPQDIDAAHRRFVVGDEPVILHCHHYNTFLQQSIQDADYIDSTPFLVGAANEVAYAQLSALFAAQNVQDVQMRRTLAQELYRWAGFGRVDLSRITENGGSVRAPYSHYSSAWVQKFGQATAPVDLFTTGWITGAAAAILDAPQGAFSARQAACVAMGATENQFEITRSGSTPNYELFRSPKLGPLTDHEPLGVPPNNVDYEGIFGALSAMDISGDEQGCIPAFGVYLTRHYANYYNRISFEFCRAMQREFGSVGVDLAEPLLVEAGHVCAFNTFGGIMISSAWDAMIRPSLQNRQDWVHGMVAAVNALGWGRWQVSEVSEKTATFVLHDDYEAVGHLAAYGNADRHVSYLAEGAAAGILDLVYIGDVMNKPTFDNALYQRLFKSEHSYQTNATSSRATGDQVTTIVVSQP